MAAVATVDSSANFIGDYSGAWKPFDLQIVRLQFTLFFVRVVAPLFMYFVGCFCCFPFFVVLFRVVRCALVIRLYARISLCALLFGNILM